MTKKRILLIFIIFLTLINVSYSQVLSEQEQAVEENAFKNLSQKKYKKAGELFSQLLSIYRKNSTYNFYYGVCLVEQNKDIDLALKYIKYAEQNNLPEEDAIELNYYLGRVYHLSYNFETALMYYKDFYDEMGADAIKLYDIDREIRMAENGKELIKYISDLVVIDNKKINQENYYYSYKLDDYGGKLIVKPDEYKTKLDKKNTHTQLMFLSDSGIVLYSSYGKKSKTLDIYQKTKDENGIWSEAEILPNTINTKYDDDFPYLHSDGKTLYFASKGHNSMGGYDIFKSELDTTTSQWAEPINMDFPTNTPYDDFLYISDKNDEYAYFASNRETTGDKISIYKILIDKNPVERKIENLEEIKTKSLLQVSPLALVDETKTKNSEFISNKTKTNKSDNLTDNKQYNYERLSISDILTNEEANRLAKEDYKKQTKAVEETKQNANNALIYSYTKHQEADELYKSANDILSQDNLSQTDRQRAKKMKVEAKLKEEEAILAFNVYRNLKSDVSQKERETESISISLTQVENSTSIEQSVEIINNNREKTQDNKEKYFNITKETTSRKEKLVEISSKKEKLEPNIIKIKKDIDENNKQITILVKEGKTAEVESLKKKNNDLIKTYKEELSKQEKLAFEEQKLKNEISFLSNIENNRTSVGKTELAEKIQKINEEDLISTLDEKSLKIEAENKTLVNKSVEKQTSELITAMELAENTDELADNITTETDSEVIEVNNTNEKETENINDNSNNETEVINVEKNETINNTVVPTIVVTKKISEDDYNSQEAKFIVEEVNSNLKVVDSLNYTIAVKKQELNKETNQENKKKIENEIADLEMFVGIKNTKNKQLLAKANQVDKPEENINTNEIADNSNKTNTDLELIYKKNEELNTLYTSLNKNLILVDSLEALSKEKEDLIAKTNDEGEKEILKNEVDDLKKLASIKKTENDNVKIEISKQEEELKTIAVNTNPDFKDEDLFPFDNSNSSDKVKEYNKELFKQKYYQSKQKELEARKQNLEQTKKNLTTITAKEEINNQIVLLDEKIRANAELALVCKIKSEELSKTITNDIDTQISDEQLYAEASSYQLKNVSSLNQKEKDDIEFVKEDKSYAGETYKNYKNLEKELSQLQSNLDNVEQATDKAKIQNQIDITKQDADKQFNMYNNTMSEANYVEFQNLEKIISNYSDKSVKNDDADKLKNEAKAYYIQANIIRKSASGDKKELEKAINYEKIAINKQKQSLDMYLSETPSNNLADNNSNSITLSLEDEENIEKSNKIAYSSEKILSENKTELNNTETELEKENKVLGSKNDKNIVKLEAKKVELQKNIINSLIEYQKADSIKYNVYNNKISDLNNSSDVDEENKIRASQYINESEYFYSNAQILRNEAEKEKDTEKKLFKLEKAKQLEQTSISNQETAFNILLNKNDDIFTSYGNLIKIDPLLSANKQVNTDDVKKATSEKIYSSIKLEEDEIETINKLPEFETKLVEVDKEIETLNTDKKELEKLRDTAENEKAKNKYQKKIDKLDNEIFALKFTKAESTETLNDGKYYVLKNNLSENKIRGETEKARKGNQLSKDANKYYNRAKTLRNKSETTEDSEKAYAYLLEANELELEGIDAMERAYSIFLGIEPREIANNLAENNTKNSEIDNNIVEVKTADITELKTETNLNNDIAENTIANNTITENNNNISDNSTSDTNNKTNTTEDNTINTETENTITNELADNTNNTTTNELDNNSNNSKTYSNFSIYPISVYTSENPIPVNPNLPEGIVFKVQVGAFKNRVRDDAFNGLSPLSAEKIQGSAYTRYLVGQFKSYEAGKLALNEVKTLGYKDAFVVAYKNGKRVPLYIAKSEVKNISNYNLIASEETANIKNRSKNALTNSQITNNETFDNTSDNNAVKASDIKSKNNLLYTVQIGVYKKAVSHSRLYNLSPIYEDVTQYGYIRYTTGIFNNITIANTEKERIRKVGITDAFVTAYYNGKRISITEANKLKSENVNTEGQQNIELPQLKTENTNSVNSNTDISKIRYKIQIGAYKTQVPINEVKSFLSVARTKNLEQFIDDRGYTIFAIGSYDNYQEASKMKTILINEGITDAFVVAYNANVKISVAKAKELLGK